MSPRRGGRQDAVEGVPRRVHRLVFPRDAGQPPGGWPNAYSRATARSPAISTSMTSPRTPATEDGEFSRCGHTRTACIVSDMTQNSTPVSDPKIEAVQRLYAAYGRGDVDAMFADLAEDVDWAAEAASTSVPWYGSYRGKGEVPRFTQEIGSNVEVTEFTLVSIASNETDVMAIIHWTYTVNTTGKSAAMYMQHWWRFADGKIVFFRGSEDSEQSAAAFA